MLSAKSWHSHAPLRQIQVQRRFAGCSTVTPKVSGARPWGKGPAHFREWPLSEEIVVLGRLQGRDASRYLRSHAVSRVERAARSSRRWLDWCPMLPWRVLISEQTCFAGIRCPTVNIDTAADMPKMTFMPHQRHHRAFSRDGQYRLRRT